MLVLINLKGSITYTCTFCVITEMLLQKVFLFVIGKLRGQLIYPCFPSAKLGMNILSVWLVGGKFFFLVKCMNLMYITNFKVFGYSHPFRRKMQTKVNLLKETWFSMWCFFPCAFGPYVLWKKTLHGKPCFLQQIYLSLHFSPEWVGVTKNFKVYNVH